MITSALFGALLIARALAGTALRPRGRDAVGLIDRLLVPTGVAFAALVLLKLLDAWLGDA